MEYTDGASTYRHAMSCRPEEEWQSRLAEDTSASVARVPRPLLSGTLRTQLPCEVAIGLASQATKEGLYRARTSPSALLIMAKRQTYAIA